MTTGAIIFGAGGFAREVFSLLKDMGVQVAGFIAPEGSGNIDLPMPYLGKDENAINLFHGGVKNAYLAIGDMKTRKRVHDFAKGVGFRFPSLVHPKSVFMTDTPPGDASIIYPGVIVMTGCLIRTGVLLNAGCTIGHDSTVGNFCNINPGANIGGFVDVGDEVMVGIGSCIVENTSIGEKAIVGAGSIVKRDVPKSAVVFANSAKKKANE